MNPYYQRLIIYPILAASHFCALPKLQCKRPLKRYKSRREIVLAVFPRVIAPSGPGRRHFNGCENASHKQKVGQTWFTVPQNPHNKLNLSVKPSLKQLHKLRNRKPRLPEIALKVPPSISRDREQLLGKGIISH
jgi:hypothetical protein